MVQVVVTSIRLVAVVHNALVWNQISNAQTPAWEDTITTQAPGWTPVVT